MKVVDIIELLEADGWMMTRFEIAKGTTKRRFTHKTKPGSIYIIGDDHDPVKIKAANSIMKRAGIKTN